MSVSRARYVDARQSTFNQAGRDLHNHHTVQYHIHVSPGNSQQGSHRVAIDITNNTLSQRPSPDSSAQRQLVRYPSSDVVLDVDTATGLIDEITCFLIGRKRSWSNRRDLVAELESLHQLLTLTNLTIQKYGNTPLGQSLVNMIDPEIKQCSAALQKLVDSVNGTWLDFTITNVSGFWRRIWCGELGGDKLASLRKQLSHSRQSLQVLLVTLDSYVLHFLTNDRHPLKHMDFTIDMKC
jgi:hypothetical protein